MAESQSSLYERRMAAGCGPWADVYGGADDNFEVKRFHDGWFIDGVQHNNEVKDCIDLFNGVLCRIIRPDHPKLVEAEERAKQTGVEHIGKTDLHEEVVGFMERLQAAYNTLGIGKGRVLLGVTGSGINSMAFRLAHGYTRGGENFYLRRAYHGADGLGIAVNDVPGWPGDFPPALAGGRHYVRHDNDGVRNEELARMESMVRRFKTIGSRSKFTFEDIQGVGGSFHNPGEEFLTRAIEMLAEYEGAAINDNVQTGMRLGSYLSIPHWLRRTPSKPIPIIDTLSKALANGAPLAAALVPETIVEDMQRNPGAYGNHWDTFSDNVRTAALGSAVYDVYHGEKLGERTPQVRDAIVSEIQHLVHPENGPVTEIRGAGLMIGIAVKDPKTNVPLAVARAPEFGIKIGKGADALRVAPLADTPLDIAKLAGERLARLLDSLPKAA